MNLSLRGWPRFVLQWHVIGPLHPPHVKLWSRLSTSWRRDHCWTCRKTTWKRLIEGGQCPFTCSNTSMASHASGDKPWSIYLRCTKQKDCFLAEASCLTIFPSSWNSSHRKHPPRPGRC